MYVPITECFVTLSSAYSSFSAPSATPDGTTATAVISTTPATTDISTTATSNDATTTIVTVTQPPNSPNPRMMADDETGNGTDTLMT